MTSAHIGERNLFPTLEADVYLNHAAISPPSTAVRAAVLACVDDYGREGVAHYVAEMERRDRVRAALATLLGGAVEDVAVEDVALIANTSAGVRDVAVCIPWQAGDRIVLFRGEFPANITPWQQAAAAHDLTLVWLDSEEFRLNRAEALQKLEEVLRQGARLVALSLVQFATGQRMPVETIGALCRRYDCELFVDAIQGLGVMPVDVRRMGIHYLSAGGHKWMMAMEGTGVLYVAPESAAKLRPLVASWLSHDEPFGFLFEGPGHLRYDRPIVKRAAMVEGGSSNVLGIAAMEASLHLLLTLGIDAIFAHVQAWHDRIEPLLLERGFESARMATADGRSASLSVLPPGEAGAPAWSAALAARGISCACPDGWLRLAPHWPNALAEVDVVIAAIDGILADGSADDHKL